MEYTGLTFLSYCANLLRILVLGLALYPIQLFTFRCLLDVPLPGSL